LASGSAAIADPALQLGPDQEGTEIARAASGQRIVLPLTVDAGTGAVSLDFFLGYDPAVLQPVVATVTPWTSEFTVAMEIARPGELRVSLVGPPVAGTGEAVWVVMDVFGTAGTATDLVWFEMAINGRRSNLPVNGVSLEIVESGAWIGIPECTSSGRGSQVELGIFLYGVQLAREVNLDLRFAPDQLTLVDVTTADRTLSCTWKRHSLSEGTETLVLSCPDYEELHGQVGSLIFKATDHGGGVPVDLRKAETESEAIPTLGDGLVAVCAHEGEGKPATCCADFMIDSDASTGWTDPDLLVPGVRWDSHSSQDVTPEVGDSLRIDLSGTTSVMTWSDDGVPGPFNVYRGGRTWDYTPAFGCAVFETVDPQAEDTLEPLPNRAFYYVVSRVGVDGESVLHRDATADPSPNPYPCPDPPPDVDGDGWFDTTPTRSRRTVTPISRVTPATTAWARSTRRRTMATPTTGEMCATSAPRPPIRPRRMPIWTGLVTPATTALTR